MKGPNDRTKTVITAIATLNKLMKENEYQGVCTPSLVDMVKQYALSKCTKYTGATYRYMCFKFNNTENHIAALMKLP